MMGALSWLVEARSGRLIATFLMFVVVQAVFAGIYFRLYNQRQDSFVFGADILRSQSLTARAATERSLLRLQGAIAALQETLKELDRGVKPVVNGRLDASLLLPSGRKCVMVFLTGPPVGGPRGSRLNVIDSDGQMLLDADPTEFSFRGYLNSAAWLQTAAEWRTTLPRILTDLELRQAKEIHRIASLETAVPDIWSYWDFLYFSTIVQTTVGFGDILPNNTLVRLIVVCQIVIGYALLVVVLNIVLGS